MDAAENPVLEPRSERIARYKAERRRELAERFGHVEELPSKWVRRNRNEGPGPATEAHGGAENSDGLSERVNGSMREVTNGLEDPAESDRSRRWVTCAGKEDWIEGAAKHHTAVTHGKWLYNYKLHMWTCMWLSNPREDLFWSFAALKILKYPKRFWIVWMQQRVCVCTFSWVCMWRRARFSWA